MSDRGVARARRLALPAGIAALVVVADQASKMVVARRLGPDGSEPAVPVLGPALAFDYVENRGAAFGVFRGQGTVLALLAGAVLAGLIAYYCRRAAPGVWLAAAVGLIAGGAVGNLIDRLRFGYVIDFVAVGPWPKFNLADSAITIGVVLLAVEVLLPQQAEAQARALPTARPSDPSPSADG